MSQENVEELLLAIKKKSGMHVSLLHLRHTLVNYVPFDKFDRTEFAPSDVGCFVWPTASRYKSVVFAQNHAYKTYARYDGIISVSDNNCSDAL